MIRQMVYLARLYLFQAWFSYRSLYAWSTPFSYLTSKFGFPFFSMIPLIFSNFLAWL